MAILAPRYKIMGTRGQKKRELAEVTPKRDCSLVMKTVLQPQDLK